ncbi:MAG: alpha/beta fold hydrolase [Acidobacteria bacterium]|nr:alpha/beta fold hydrolase [Acidobacteriota bacterium]
MLSGFLLTLAFVEIALPLLLFLMRDRVVFLPSVEPAPEDGLAFLRGRADVDLVRVRRSDGRVLAAYDARPAGNEDPPAPVVLFLHGNGGNIANRLPLLEDFVAGSGLRTLLLDYSGYGGNAGTPSEAEAYEDGVAAFDWLVDQGVAPERIVLYGESLGAAVALGVAERRVCAGVVAQSAFASLSSMAFEAYPWMPLAGLLARGSFPSDRRVRELEVPLLVVHGTRDGIIPFSQGEKLHRAAAAGTEFLAIEGAGHNDLLSVAGRPYLESLGERLRGWVGSRSGTLRPGMEPPVPLD